MNTVFQKSFFLYMFENNLYSLLEKKSDFIYVLLLLFQIALLAVGKKEKSLPQTDAT